MKLNPFRRNKSEVKTALATSKSFEATDLLTDPNLRRAYMTGQIMVWSGCISPDTQQPYAMEEDGSINLLKPSPEEFIHIGSKALFLAGLINYCGNGSTSKPETTAANEAVRWGSQLVMSNMGVREGVDELIKRPIKTAKGIYHLVNGVHQFLGKPGGLKYDVSSHSLLHAQTEGAAQCVVFTTLADQALGESIVSSGPLYAFESHVNLLVESTKLAGDIIYEGTVIDKPVLVQRGKFASTPQPTKFYGSDNIAADLWEAGRITEAEAVVIEALRRGEINPTIDKKAAHMSVEATRQIPLASMQRILDTSILESTSLPT
jgi:hypothetical protein